MIRIPSICLQHCRWLVLLSNGKLLSTNGDRTTSRRCEMRLAAQAAGGSSSGEPCDFRQHACPKGSACVGYKGALKWPQSAGRCVAATARYVPAYSTVLRRAVFRMTSSPAAKTCRCKDARRTCMRLRLFKALEAYKVF